MLLINKLRLRNFNIIKTLFLKLYIEIYNAIYFILDLKSNIYLYRNS